MPAAPATQIVQFGTTPSSVNGADTTVFVNLPNRTLQGNGVLVFFQTGTSPTAITAFDDVGNIYTVTQTSNGGQKGWCAYKMGCKAGARKITFTPNASANFCQFDFVELAFIAADSTPVFSASDTTNTGTVQAGNIACVAGDFVCQYGYGTTSTPVTSAVTSYTKGSGFTVLGGCRRDGHFAQWRYAAGGTFNPQFTVGGSTDNFESFAFTVQSGPSGRLPDPGIRIFAVHQFAIASGVGGTSHAFDVPMVGNLLASSHVWFNVSGACSPSSISDTAGNTHTQRGSAQNGVGGTGTAASWDGQGGTPSDTNVVTVTLGTAQSDGSTLYFYDIKNADASAFDAVGQGTGTQGSSGDITGTASVTPTTRNGLVLGVIGIVSHSTAGLASPYEYDSPGMPFEDGGGNPFHQDNGWGHYYNADLTAAQFVWQTQNNTAGVAGWASKAVAYKAARAATFAGSYENPDFPKDPLRSYPRAYQ